MLSKIDKEEKIKVAHRIATVEHENTALQKELEVLKKEKKAIEKEYNSRNNFVEGLLSHMLAKKITITHQDGAVEERWQPVNVITGSENRYSPQGRW